MMRCNVRMLTTAAALLSMAAPVYAARVVVRVSPPAPRVEAVPALPVAGYYVWTPGYWRWDGARYVWIPGIYVAPPHAGAVWVPGHWVAGRRGWVWAGGHWR